jgi:ABC-type Mn2+/Zn2+ transport system permease subunit
LKEDTAIGVVFAGMFALGIALISSQASFAVDLTHILFGNVLGVSWDDLVVMAILGGAVVLTIVALYKEFVLITFDRVLAETLRLPNQRLYYLFLILIAVTVVVSLQTVGAAMMVAMLVTPAATAFLLTRRLPVMMVLSAGIGAVSGAVGLYGSYTFSVASGAAIVLVCTAMFVVAYLLAPEQGRLSNLLRNGR